MTEAAREDGGTATVPTPAPDDAVLVLGGAEILDVLRGREADVMAVVRRAYETHRHAGGSVLPHSTFVRLPAGDRRIIALPAYLGGSFNVAGVKWIASFPSNHGRGLPRASGVVVLSSADTGRPIALCEGSSISAKRTAASAALAARCLHPVTTPRVGLIGCGEINFEILQFLRHVWPAIEQVVVTDLTEERALRFVGRCRQAFDGLDVRIRPHARAVLAASTLVSMATTATRPYLDDLDGCAAHTILHISLRDIAPGAIAACDNVVDDVEHVCRAETSLHLAEQLLGHRRFIRCTIGELLTHHSTPPRRGGIRVFSPFGLGILDLAVTQLTWERATARAIGLRLSDFNLAGIS